MGYQVYDVKGDRFGGYGVPSICDHPDCTKEIDRGLSYCCGGNPRSDEFGCQQYFYEDHLKYAGNMTRICERCEKGEEPFPMKPDTKEWIRHIMTDPSWQEWRDNNLGKIIPLPQN